MSLEEAVEYLAGIINRAERHTPDDITGFTPVSDGCVVAGVDGGSAIIFDGWGITLCAYRAGHMKYKDGKLHSMNIPPPEITVLTGENSIQSCEKTLSASTPEKRVDPERAVSSLREAQELNEILHLIKELPEGSIIVFDGSFDLLRSLSSNQIEDMKSRLDHRGISLVGVSKSTSLSVHGLPFNLAFMNIKSNSCWYSRVEAKGLRLGSCHAVKFHPVSRYIFRVDICAKDIEHTLKTLASYATDPFYLGYPYPLAHVHNRVSLAVDEREGILSEIERRLPPLHQEGFETLITDFHEVLDMAR